MEQVSKDNVNFIYNYNIENAKRYKNFTSKNTFVISSYTYNIYHNYENYNGISYELYYIDNDNNIQQLTKNLIEGNGILLKDNKITINIDNQTLESKYDKNSSTYYINVNTQNFKESSYLNKGLLNVDNDLYYNDNYYDSTIENGSFKFNNEIDLSTGLLSDLQLIKFYYNGCINKMSSINNLYDLCLREIDQSIFINVGDILYYNPLNKKYSFKKSEDNIPYMVCVIGSNVLEDCQPRFIKINRDNESHVFDKSTSLYVKSAFNYIPNYNTNILSYVNISTDLVNSTYGFIATNYKKWNDNYVNPLNNTEHYYANIPRAEKYEEQYQTNSYVEVIDKYYNVNWYCDLSKVNLSNYEIESYGIFSDLLTQDIINKYNEDVHNLDFLFHIQYSNGITKKYNGNFIIENKRILNNEKLYPYDSINSILTNSNYIASSELDTLQQSRTEKHNNINTTYISYFDNSRNVNILSNENATNIYNQYNDENNNTWWYKEYNQGIIGETINSIELFKQYQYQISQSRINVKIPNNLCDKDCYMKVSLILKNNKVHSEYFIKYNNTSGIHYVLEDISSTSINDSSFIKIQCYQTGDFSDNPYTLPSINIQTSSQKIYGDGGMILNCVVDPVQYSFIFNPIIESINVENVIKDYWIYNNNITKYVNLNKYATLLNNSNIQQHIASTNYYIDLNKCNCQDNNNIYKSRTYLDIHLHSDGIYIDISKNIDDFNWDSYNEYYIDFEIYYIPIFDNNSNVKINYYDKIEMNLNLTMQKLSLKNTILIPKNLSISKFVITNIYAKSTLGYKNISNYINLSKQGEVKNYNSAKQYMNYDEAIYYYSTYINSTYMPYGPIYNSLTYEISL